MTAGNCQPRCCSHAYSTRIAKTTPYLPTRVRVSHACTRLCRELPVLRVKRLSEWAILPSRGSPLSAGYDLSAAHDMVVPARGKALVKTDLGMIIPETYA